VLRWNKSLRQDGEHSFALCPCGNSFPVRWCTTSLLPCSCLSGQGVSWSLDRKRGAHSLPSRSPGLSLLDFFWKCVTDNFYCERRCQMWMSSVTESSELQNALLMKCLSRSGENLNIVYECCTTNGAHIEIYRVHKKLCEMQWLKVYQFLRHALWLKIYKCFILLPFKTGYSVFHNIRLSMSHYWNAEQNHDVMTFPFKLSWSSDILKRQWQIEIKYT
jgi:hypothetical protein